MKEPVSGPPAHRLAQRLDRPSGVLGDLGRLDLAIYRAIAATPTPALDEPLRRLSRAADHSKLWLAAAAGMAAFGGPRGRRAALTGVVAIAATSAIVNLPAKLWFRRPRPDAAAARVPQARRSQMPASPSFPSGHTASGFAFAAAVAGTAPGAGKALRLLASAVGYSRIHTGAHYPGDVVVGALIGTLIGDVIRSVPPDRSALKLPGAARRR